MNSFKRHIYRQGLGVTPGKLCTMTVGKETVVGTPNDYIFYINGVTAPTDVTIEFTLTGVFDDDPTNPMSIGINGSPLTEGVPLVVNTTVTPGGGVTYDYEGFITPLTNFDPAVDKFTVTMVVTSVENINCIIGSNTETFDLGTEPIIELVDLYYDASTSCPNANAASYYILGGDDNWLSTTQIYTNPSGTILAPAGHYTPVDSLLPGFGTSREWDGNQFITDTACP